MYNRNPDMKKKESKKRALTSLPLPKLIEETSIIEMEFEQGDSYHDLPVSTNGLYMSPRPNNSDKNKLNTTCPTDCSSLNKFVETIAKRKDEIQDEIYFENILSKMQNFGFRDFLRRHEITDKLRGKMMDWMIEVLNIYKQKDETLFRSFSILDSYLAHRQTPLRTNDLHLIGTVCMMIASKQEEISQIRLNVIYNDICKCKFEKDTIIDFEINVLTTVQFQTRFPTPFELIKCGLRLLDVDDQETMGFIENISSLIAKMCLFSYPLINKYSYIEISAASICISLKLVENLKPFFLSDCHVNL